MEKTLRLISNSEADTQKIGARLASQLDAGAFVALRGGLGAGKTAFARGFVQALGDEGASSPTFALVHEHDTRPPVFHFDVYRLQGVEDLDTIGYDDYFLRKGIILMEWPERIEEALPSNRIEVRFTVLDENTRGIAIASVGNAPEIDFS